MPVPRKRTRLLVALAGLAVAAAALLPAMPQPLSYHAFADARPMLGVANFLDVTSNVAFLLVGVAGLVVAWRPSTRFTAPSERVLYTVFFLGLVLTAGGSAHYHLAPDNETLFWDRVPMAITFMALVATQVAERVSLRVGVVLLLPLLVVGVGTVVHWRATERAGAGNMTPYVVLQAFSVVAALLLARLPSRYTRANDLYLVFAAYVGSKVLEVADREVLATVRLVSGHTLKHLAAALAGYFVLRMIARRDPAPSPSAPP